MSLFNEADVRALWRCARTHNSSIPDEALDSMRDTLLANLRRAPMVVPAENWLADQLCDLRNRWAEGCEPGWLETDDNHPDDWMAKELRQRLLAARGDV